MPAKQPGDLHQLFVAGVSAHDLDGLMALYEPNSITADMSSQPLRTQAELREFLTEFLSIVKRLDGETRRVLIAGETALLSSSWRAVMSAPDGGETQANGVTAEVARQQPDGTWRFLIDDPMFGN